MTEDEAMQLFYGENETGLGFGDGYGSGDGYGKGYGDGYGDGYGKGYGEGYGSVDGSGSGYGHGDGCIDNNDHVIVDMTNNLQQLTPLTRRFNMHTKIMRKVRNTLTTIKLGVADCYTQIIKGIIAGAVFSAVFALVVALAATEDFALTFIKYFCVGLGGVCIALFMALLLDIFAASKN
jgi:hypothetical protein